MKDITPYNKKGKRHGYWESYRTNGSIGYKRFYYNDKKVGYEEWYHYDWKNKLRYKKYYI